jgi:hypothetical protein
MCGVMAYNTMRLSRPAAVKARMVGSRKGAGSRAAEVGWVRRQQPLLQARARTTKPWGENIRLVVDQFSNRCTFELIIATIVKNRPLHKASNILIAAC